MANKQKQTQEQAQAQAQEQAQEQTPYEKLSSKIEESLNGEGTKCSLYSMGTLSGKPCRIGWLGGKGVLTNSSIYGYARGGQTRKVSIEVPDGVEDGKVVTKKVFAILGSKEKDSLPSSGEVVINGKTFPFQSDKKSGVFEF